MPPTDPLGIFIGPLQSQAIPYMVTGGFAAILYGEPRLTNDIDLVLSIHDQDSRKLATAFPEKEFYLPPADVIVAESRRPARGHFNIIHHSSGFKADIYLVNRDPFQLWAWERRKEIAIESRPVWLAPPEYVVVKKLEYYREGGSPKHLEDIRAMLRISGAAIQMAQIEIWVKKFRLQQEWKTCRRGEKG